MRSTLGIKLRLIVLFMTCISVRAAEFTITIDDPNLKETPLFSPEERNLKILEALEACDAQAALFVCGKRVDDPAGRALIESWDMKGHWIANHSYSHLYFHSEKITIDVYQKDMTKDHNLIKGFKNFVPLFRFPYLKEGNTDKKRDAMRSFLQRKGYRNGYVTVDASDWYINERLISKLEEKPNTKLQPYKDFYLKHMWERAQYYEQLAQEVLDERVRHTILIHHNLLNAIFLKDLIKHFQEQGWELIRVSEAYKDPPFNTSPEVLPAGESIIWSLALERDKSGLRYPAEDSGYEKAEMDALGL